MDINFFGLVFLGFGMDSDSFDLDFFDLAWCWVLFGRFFYDSA